MWAYARLVNTVGCNNVPVRCESTDVQHLLASYQDGGFGLEAAHSCIKRKCLNRQ